MSYLERDPFGRMILKGPLTQQVQTPFGERGAIAYKSPERSPIAPPVTQLAYDLPSAPPISTQIRSTGRPNVPTPYVRPDQWPRDKPISGIPSAVSVISGPERSVLPQTISVLMGEVQEARSDVELQLQKLAVKPQVRKQTKVATSRANHRTFGLRNQMNIPLLADLQQSFRNRVVSLQQRLEQFRQGQNGTQPQRLFQRRIRRPR